MPQDDGTAIKDWLLLLAVRIAEVRRLMGETSISSKEADVIRDLAGSLGRPIPVGGSA